MNERWIVSAYTDISWREGRIVIKSNNSGARFVVEDLGAVQLLHEFARPRTVEDVVSDMNASEVANIREQINNFIRAGVLCPASASELSALHGWDPSALAYHRDSTRVPFRPCIALNLCRPQRDPAPGIPLDKCVSSSGGLPALLNARRSRREWSPIPMPFAVFSQFIALSARDRDTSRELSFVSRSYPSGGGVYSLEIYPVLKEQAVQSLTGGLYRYVPESHQLQQLPASSLLCSSFLEKAAASADANVPPILFLITSRYAMQAAMYGALAYSLILKEVGCLFQTMYLVAEHLELAGCALGGGVSGSRLARISGTSDVAEPIVGEFLLGLR